MRKKFKKHKNCQKKNKPKKHKRDLSNISSEEFKCNVWYFDHKGNFWYNNYHLLTNLFEKANLYEKMENELNNHNFKNSNYNNNNSKNETKKKEESKGWWFRLFGMTDDQFIRLDSGNDKKRILKRDARFTVLTQPDQSLSFFVNNHFIIKIHKNQRFKVINANDHINNDNQNKIENMSIDNSSIDNNNNNNNNNNNKNDNKLINDICNSRSHSRNNNENNHNIRAISRSRSRSRNLKDSTHSNDVKVNHGNQSRSRSRSRSRSASLGTKEKQKQKQKHKNQKMEKQKEPRKQENEEIAVIQKHWNPNKEWCDKRTGWTYTAVNHIYSSGETDSDDSSELTYQPLDENNEYTNDFNDNYNQKNKEITITFQGINFKKDCYGIICMGCLKSAEILDLNTQ